MAIVAAAAARAAARSVRSMAARSWGVTARAMSTSPEAGEYPGGVTLPFTTDMAFHDPADDDRIPVFRVMDESGMLREGVEGFGEDREDVTNMYTTMLRIHQLDTIFYEAQRQGRISFYMTANGEESIHVGAALGFNNDDPVYAQYREAGLLLMRGFTLQQFADQCCSNEDDGGKGRQMPVHYGSPEHHFYTISSPLTTQLPQAAGTGYAMKMEGKGRCCAVFFGEGAASEGDFHAGMNFASTLEAPVVFFCRNNGYAISTPVKDQYRGDGIASRAAGYGMPSIRVDGADVFAVREATRAARDMAVAESRPVFVEAMAYREGHHSTSDDSTRYRSGDEIAHWRETSNPIGRLRRFMESKGWWDDEREKAANKAERKAVLQALTAAEKKPAPDMSELFSDVYAGEQPWHLAEQEVALRKHMARHPEHYAGEGH
ncbi:hypothetical protein FNF27_03645 [Cafeteria roenbergensis]|uniref:2-oxoisovalerate dehydrogenase subunit alpha n=1 Tax=Cafeteria roenbergensis TaxID=33653 RepID=A0A5A8DBU5_CAFRO|nr:hypothetical protein FNF29_05230 [Cafeteria roenbergensis]KAA0160674.1 hypothetical protein FNF28_05373 [Cafeteria roenbergensis]KAA0162064.1 hypothetical protein FNF31_03475 [Cafeteria roenbergensis]KAA0174930.1 hypothetical protein FNF27_03645 [Cafeteria roenbergensis]|eukprot:KAA0150427.1 hypothetical protein FNF29_05230 [Cafeteria roenbergensis]